MGRKISFLCINLLIFILFSQPNFTQEENSYKIYENMEAANVENKDIPLKEYKAKLGVIKKDTNILDAYCILRNSNGFTVATRFPEDSNLQIDKGEIVFVLEDGISDISDEEGTSRIVTDDAYVNKYGKVKNKDISYDIDLHRNPDMVFLYHVPGYDEIEGEELGYPAKSYMVGFIDQREGEWLYIAIPGSGYYIKEKDINHNYKDMILKIEDI